MDSQIHPETLEEKTPALLTGPISNVISVFENYGWYLLALFFICLYAWSKAKPHVDKWMKDKEDREYAAKYHKDPDLEYQRLRAIELARQKMEEKYKADAAKAAERRKELEEKKRQERLQRQSGISSGHRLNEPSPQASEASEPPKKKSTMRPDYNPLMGSGGSGGYRPPRRSCCPSGGCG